MRIKMRLISREITFKPRPGRREDDAEKNCANREHDQWKRHHARTFMRMLGTGAFATEKDVDDLARHIYRGQNYADHHQIVRYVGTRPLRRRVQNLFLGPTAGKKDWHAAEGHHADGISGERDRHEFPQTAHFPNVLFVMHSVNDR